MIERLSNLFHKQWFAILVLVSLLFFQLIYSFAYPSSGRTAAWQPISQYLPKFNVENSDNFVLSKIYPLISREYRLNSDIGHNLELGRHFSADYFKGDLFLQRPLYPFLIFFGSLLTSLFVPTSYGVIFGLAILINFILIGAAAVLFFILIRKLFSLKVAWLSSILLIFSPFVHSYINQPLAEMLMAFAVVASIYLLQNYVKNPSFSKLALFSLILGVFMLGKMFFAPSIFILLLAIYFKRYKEGIVFLIIQLVPLLLWYLWITQIWQISYFVNEVQNWHFGTWFFEMLRWPWPRTYGILMNILPSFITAFIYSFLLIPVAFSIFGLQRLPFKSKNIIYFGAIFSIFLLGFLMGAYFLRHVFLLFPIIYPTAVLGMERAADHFKKYNPVLVPIFYAVVIVFMILISNINIYQVFNYNDFQRGNF